MFRKIKQQVKMGSMTVTKPVPFPSKVFEAHVKDLLGPMWRGTHQLLGNGIIIGWKMNGISITDTKTGEDIFIDLKR